jgi:catechol 2,3-dioxygenase-like lactoylglutathione lyase family enzyme
MSLRDYPVRASIAVSDMARSREFYEGELGLRPGKHQADYSQVYVCGGGASLHVYASAANAGTSTGTLATWQVTNLERVVDELAANGVRFERYDEPLQTDARGIHTLADGRVAWFKDPDGNTFAVEEQRTQRASPVRPGRSSRP